jgi:hypothetical protein
MIVNNTRLYRVALLVAMAGALLHAYENAFKSEHLSLGWFAWAMLPYAVCLIAWVRARTGAPATAGAAVALIVDLYVHYEVFIQPRSGTAALAMIFAPLWSALLFCPIAMLIAWFVARRRAQDQRRSP